MGVTDESSPERHPYVSRRFVFKGAAVIGGAGLLAACGQGGDQPEPGPQGFTFEDQRGDTVSLDGAANRIVTLPIPAASMLIAVDRGAKRLVGMHDASWVAIRDGLLGEFFPEALEVPHDLANQEFVPNVESILALRPDVVVQWGDKGAAITAPLENAGLTTAGLNYGTQEDVAAWITMFATMVGKPERGKAMLDEIESRLSKIEAAAANRSGAKPSILYFLRFDDTLTVAAENSYNDFYINLIGAQNPAAGAQGGPATGLVEVGREQILDWDPDIVVLGNFDAAQPDDMYDDRVWNSLSAVKSRRVYKAPLGGYRWDPPGQESPLMWEWLSQVAFPQPTSTLRAEIVTYYDFLYGRRPTPSQIDAILRTDVNAGSADYGQFDAT